MIPTDLQKAINSIQTYEETYEGLRPVKELDGEWVKIEDVNNLLTKYFTSATITFEDYMKSSMLDASDDAYKEAKDIFDKYLVLLSDINK